jgi:cytochrome c biogenesis protein
MSDKKCKYRLFLVNSTMWFANTTEKERCWLAIKTILIRPFSPSIKLTIILLILLVLLSILGTVIPNKESAEALAHQLPPLVFGFLQDLRLFDVYHSFLYYSLVGLLSLNLVICSVDRFRRSWSQYKAAPFPLPDRLFENTSPDRILVTDRQQEACLPSIESLLKKKYGRIRKNVMGSGTIIFVQRARVSIFGVYVVHMSILLMIAGMVVGSVFGFEGYVNIGEGESANAFDSKGGEDIHRLDFSVKCEKFTIEWYENGTPKIYRSDLSFIRNGRVIHRAQLLVNQPVSINGIRFYQSTYGISPDSRVFMVYTKEGHKSKEMMLRVGDHFELPESNASVQVLRVVGSLMQMGPAVKLGVTSPKGQIQFWIFKHIDDIKKVNPGLFSKAPPFNPALFKPYLFSLNRIEQQYYTGLQVIRDPGTPLVAAGGCLMIASLMIVFFMSHRRLWVWIDETEGKTRIRIAGRSNRNSAGLEKELNIIFWRIKETVIA